eukprot:TRINITY_DN10195_c0_g1_i1.p1 TRINITY_DN10195_c0_g1~~TRINITY_DN10195_c0_g1_i1.p1  ORF type:complete len:149 (-),score=27.68 TRINITY_DN10195_c0_g1_i1:187-633(-)
MCIRDRLQRNCYTVDTWRKGMCGILEIGIKEYDYLKHTDITKCSSDELFEQTNRFVEYLIVEKRRMEEKYAKLLELHNNLIDSSGKFSLEGIYKIKDENERLRKDLELVCSKKLYFALYDVEKLIRKTNSLKKSLRGGKQMIQDRKKK